MLAALARHGSVTVVARELGYTQPSISHHLSRLEDEVGLPLTQRAGRGIRLTPAGELLAQRATEILGRVSAAEDELAAFGGLRRGRVRVAGFQSALSGVVTTAAGSMQTSAPGIELTLQDLHPDLALQQLREGSIDVAVVFRYDDEVPQGMRFTHLFDDAMYLLSSERNQTLSDHAESPWIAGCERCRRELVSACEGAGSHHGSGTPATTRSCSCRWSPRDSASPPCPDCPSPSTRSQVSRRPSWATLAPHPRRDVRRAARPAGDDRLRPGGRRGGEDRHGAVNDSRTRWPPTSPCSTARARLPGCPSCRAADRAARHPVTGRPSSAPGRGPRWQGQRRPDPARAGSSSRSFTTE